MVKLIRCHILVLLIFTSFAWSEKCRFRGCSPAPEKETALKPENYPTYNDLTRSSGGFKNNYTDKIILRGIVIDKKCIPVANTKISLWQKDEYGQRRYLQKFASDYDRHKMNNKIYSKFYGVGTAVSDNEGRFYFITVEPSSVGVKNGKPIINISAAVKGFIKFETQVRLLEDIEKTDDKESTFVNASLNKNASEHYGKKVYDFFIVLNGESKYTDY